MHCIQVSFSCLFFVRSSTILNYVHVELNPEKQLKIKSGCFLNRVNISANQMIIGNSEGVNNRHVQFGSIKSSGKDCNGHCTCMASP